MPDLDLHSDTNSGALLPEVAPVQTAALALARKYRPQCFAELVGQTHVAQALKNAIETGRLHHAYLFTGTRGVGKTSIARILAKALNCEKLNGAEPCGTCAACQQIESGRFADYVEMDAASNRGIDEITQLLERAAYRPAQGRVKIYMVDEVHMLTTPAFNAMLKTLEEPPEYLKFVLATTDPQKVPATVLSRCLQFHLRALPAPQIAAHLAHVLQQENIPHEANALGLLARAARGSLRDALSLTDQAVALGAGQVSEAISRQMLGGVSAEKILDLLHALAAGDGAALLAHCRALVRDAANPRSVFDELISLLQRIAFLQLAPGEASSEDAEGQALSALAKTLLPEETQLLYSMALRGREDLALVPDEESALPMLLLRALAFHPARTAAATSASAAPRSAPLLRERETLRVQPARVAAKLHEPRTPRAPDSQPAIATNPELAERWGTIVGAMLDAGAVSGYARELALQSQWATQNDNGTEQTWTLLCSSATLAQSEAVGALESALNAAPNKPTPLPIRLRVIEGESPLAPFLSRQAAAQAEQRALEEEFAQSREVRAWLAAFPGAQIVPGSVRREPPKNP